MRTHLILPMLAALSSAASPAFAQSAREVLGPAAVVQLTEPQPPARLIVDPPLPGPLAQGRVFIQYRAENLRIQPVFGEAALGVSPRIGHIHVYVDKSSWHWADASGEPLILVGLKPGRHEVSIVLADPTHKPIDRVTITFVVPQTKTSSRGVHSAHGDAGGKQ